MHLRVPNFVNRSDYGGMDVYVQQLTDSTDHDLFYTDATVIVSIQIGCFYPLKLSICCLGCVQELHPHICFAICQRTDHFGMGAWFVAFYCNMM